MLAHLSPDAAIAILTLGIALIYWELNRPGSILPGALGLLAALFAIASLAQWAPRAVGIVLLATAAAILSVGLRRTLPFVVTMAATLAVVLGLFTLVRLPYSSFHIATSLFCGLILGCGSAALTNIANRAHANKRSARSNKGNARGKRG